MKVCIVGSRSFNDFEFLSRICDGILANEEYCDLEFVCGLAEGGDTLGERYAKQKGYPVKCFPARWNDISTEPLLVKINKYGKRYNALAGYNRNNEMRNYLADEGILIAFWDEISKGTKEMIDACKKRGIKTYVVKCGNI